MGPRQNPISTKKLFKSPGQAPKGNIAPDTSQPSHLPLELQQSLLNQFQYAFPFDSPTDLHSVIQEVKGHLYSRDFLAAFSKPSYLQAYALRWSASRALAYAHIFDHHVDAYLRKRQEAPLPKPPDAGEEAQLISAYRVVCIGGGAGAEVVALASALHRHKTIPAIEATAIDIADWAGVVEKLQTTLTGSPPLSKYASEVARTANRTFVESDRFKVGFMLQDVLECRDEVLREVMAEAGLCTIMFTLNELFTSSTAKTTALLLKITDMMKQGSWLLVVDSPGSYSEIKLGRKTKQYPMKWLTDHALLEAAGAGKWEKTVSDDSKWFRLPAGLKYPIELENMRYQIHLYRRLG